jgi:hypothetical protein
VKCLVLTFVIAAAGVTSSHAQATFLDLTSVTPGTSGSFTGTLAGATVNGSVSVSNPNFLFANPVGTDYFNSTTDNTSPQYSYSDIYTPSIPLTDRVGYGMAFGTNSATITITFSTPITNLVFHVANLDSMQYDFTPTAGLGGLVLLSGNGGGGDGILVSGNVISDADPSTKNEPWLPSDHPLTSGARSAYGSVLLKGTFSSLTINVSNPNRGGDAGSFTLSATTAAADAFQVRYAANLDKGDSVINLTNTGAVNGLDPAGRICANVYAFDPNEELISCCACLITPNGLKSLSAQNNLLGNTLTPGKPTGIVIKLLATTPDPTAGTCDPATPTAANLAPGMRAWGTSLHALPTTPVTYGSTETPFSQAELSVSELQKLTSYCQFIQNNGSGYGICKSCRTGGLGANSQ